MIARMEKLFIAGPKRLAPLVLFELQRAGVVQVDALPQDRLGHYQLGSEEEARLKKWEGVALVADHASSLLELEFEEDVEPFGGDLEEAADTASSYERRAGDLVEKRERLRDELQLVDQYQEVLNFLAEAVHGLDRSPRLSVIPFLAERREDLAGAKQALASRLDDRFLLAKGKLGNIIVAVVVTLKRDAEEARGILAHEGWRELPVLAENAGIDLKIMAAWLTERSKQAPEELAAVEDELLHLRQEIAGNPASLWLRATDEANRLHIFKAMASGHFGFALFGWVPVSRKNRIMELMRRLGDQVLYTTEAAEEHQEPKQVPVMLENPRWVKPFEALITFLTTPRYDSWDPTWTIAIFFPLWFGMIVGDLGYGLAFAGLAWYLQGFVRRNQVFRLDLFKLRLPPAAVAQLVSLMKPMIAWTLLWGWVYGEFLGNLFQRLGIFATPQHPGLIPTLIPRIETSATATTLILVSIGFGIVQVLHGFALKAKLSWRQGETRHFWEGCGYFGGVLALVLFGYAFMTSSYPLGLIIPMLAGAALFAAGVIGARSPLMLAELPTQGGHILSYIRIYAVGLASAVLANLATNAGFGLSRTGGIVGMVLGGLIGLLLGLLIHALLTTLLIATHVLQPIRLIWVEFFTKFDFYSLRGRPYRPFKLHGGQS